MDDFAIGPGFLAFLAAYAARRSSLIRLASADSSSSSEPNKSKSSSFAGVASFEALPDEEAPAHLNGILYSKVSI